MLNCLGICNREGIKLAGSLIQTIKGKPSACFEVGGAYCRTCERRILQSSLIKGKCMCCKGKVRLQPKHKMDRIAEPARI